MSVTTKTYSEVTSPTTTFSSQAATSLTYSGITSSTVTFTEKSPTHEGTFYEFSDAEDYDSGFYEGRILRMGRR